MTAQDTETSPLLRTSTNSRDDKPKLCVAARATVAISSLLLLFSIMIGSVILEVPRVEVLENILCRKRYPDAALGSNDPRCKEDDVQSDLSMLKAVEISCGLLPGLLTSVPWGVVADRYGRLFVLRLTMLGVVLCEGSNIVIYRFPETFSVKLIWATPSFMILGGGVSMANAMIYTVANDISSEAQRSTSFFIIAATTMIADLAAKPLTYAAMERGAWFAISTGYACLVVCLVSLFILPPILVKLGDFNLPAGDEQEQDAIQPHTKAGPLEALRQHIYSGATQISESFRFLFSENTKLGVILLSIMLTTLGKDANVVLLQYITKRFSLSWSQANLFLSVNSFIALGLVLVILPAISQFLLVKMNLSPLAKDVWMARGSILVLIGGAFGIGLATTPPSLVIGLSLFSLGSGFNLSARSLLATVASGNHVAMLYTTVTFVEVAGLFVASPALAALFRVGLKMGGFWAGLPFLSAACLFTLAAVILFGVRFSDTDRADYVPPSRQNGSADDEREDD